MAKSLVSQALHCIGKNWSKAKLTREASLRHTAAFARFVSQKYGLDKISGLKPHMCESYVRDMEDRGVSPRTICNHLTSVRSLAAAVGKANIVARENKAYGLAQTRMNPKIENHQAVQHIKDALMERAEGGDRVAMMMHAAAELREQFGLRAKESLMTSRVVGGKLRVEGAKGGRFRELEIRTDAQRAAVELAHRTAQALGSQTGKILPPEMTLKEAYDAQRSEWARLGGTTRNNAHMHAARHTYAQQRLSEGASRQKITEELGHGRLDVLGNYIPK